MFKNNSKEYNHALANTPFESPATGTPLDPLPYKNDIFADRKGRGAWSCQRMLLAD